MNIFEEATKLRNERYNRDKLFSTTGALIARFRLSAEGKSKMQGACRHLADAWIARADQRCSNAGTILRRRYGRGGTPVSAVHVLSGPGRAVTGSHAHDRSID